MINLQSIINWCCSLNNQDNTWRSILLRAGSLLANEGISTRSFSFSLLQGPNTIRSSSVSSSSLAFLPALLIRSWLISHSTLSLLPNYSNLSQVFSLFSSSMKLTTTSCTYCTVPRGIFLSSRSSSFCSEFSYAYDCLLCLYSLAIRCPWCMSVLIIFAQSDRGRWPPALGCFPSAY